MRHEARLCRGRQGRPALGCRRPPDKLLGEARPIATLQRGATLRYAGTIGVLVLVSGLALDGPASGQRELPQPVFEETACDLPGLSPEIRPRLRCGTVSVPRNYSNPGAGRFKLAVVVVRRAQQPTFPEPVVYISGGPGGPLTIYTDHQARTPYAPSRDLILIDQRGTGRSEPNLCPDLDGAFLDAAVAIATEATDDALAKRRAVYAACHAGSTARGVELKDFGTSVTVADFEGCGGRLDSSAGTSTENPTARPSPRHWSHCIPRPCARPYSIRSILRTRGRCTRPTLPTHSMRSSDIALPIKPVPPLIPTWRQPTERRCPGSLKHR